jgi:deazaflavin-dependent oxidoreductase (nitroreductase family)
MAVFNKDVISEFRANDGKVDGVFEEGTMLLLHHVGVRSGVERVNPLGYFTAGDRIFVVASFGGSDVNPAWYNNLLAHPHTTVEIGSDTIPVTAREVTGAETRRALREDSRDYADVRRLSTKDHPRHPGHRACSGLTESRTLETLPVCVLAMSAWLRDRSALYLHAHAGNTATRQCREARWDPLIGRPRMSASRAGPAIELATAYRKLAIDRLLPRAGGVVAMTVLRSS